MAFVGKQVCCGTGYVGSERHFASGHFAAAGTLGHGIVQSHNGSSLLRSLNHGTVIGVRAGQRHHGFKLKMPRHVRVFGGARFGVSAFVCAAVQPTVQEIGTNANNGAGFPKIHVWNNAFAKCLLVGKANALVRNRIVGNVFNLRISGQEQVHRCTG